MRSAEVSQRKILEFIKREIDEKGYPPSVREICAGVGLKSTSTVHAHLNHLERQGLIRRDPTKPRAMEVIDGTQARGRSVPLVGRVTAGCRSSPSRTSRTTSRCRAKCSAGTTCSACACKARA